MPGANSLTCMQIADECVPSINNKRAMTEKAFLNTIELLEDRRHTISATAGPTPTVNSSQERPDL